METEPNEEKKSHIYEVDFLRALTVFSVVAIHSIASTSYLYSSSFLATRYTALFIHLLHYNREIFVFVTALVLTYVYHQRSFSTKKFWGKRLLFIFVPYVLWSFIYVKLNNPTLPLGSYLSLSAYDVLTGNASYQLYYILLALQYYAIFPFFLRFIKKIGKHPLTVLCISFIIQVSMIYIDFTYFQKGTFTNLPFINQFFLPYQDRLFITYQFFFVFGAIVALYINTSYQLIRKYGPFLIWPIIVVLSCYALYFFHQLNIKEPMSYALTVLQPSVIIYSTCIIPFFAWISTVWAKKKKMFGCIKAISDASFGIFFVHVLILNYVIQKLVPILQPTVPIVEIMITTVILTFTSALLLSHILLYIPFLGWTVGRGRKKR